MNSPVKPLLPCAGGGVMRAARGDNSRLSHS
jgi:hypothetical protein